MTSASKIFILIAAPLNVGNKLVSDFKEKARLFMIFFVSNCTPITNDNSLSHLLNLSLTFNLSAINFTVDDISKIIRSLNINKAHGHDDISVRVIELCDKAILKPLSIIYKNCTDTWMLSDSLKNSNIVPVHKKWNKQLLENYRPVSLLPIKFFMNSSFYLCSARFTVV